MLMFSQGNADVLPAVTLWWLIKGSSSVKENDTGSNDQSIPRKTTAGLAVCPPRQRMLRKVQEHRREQARRG